MSGFRLTRAESLERLRADVLDVLIVGGGINGAGIARDLSLRAGLAKRPLRIGLADKGHFSAGTSGRNSQLIHGGLRYLENLEFGLVREALRERETLLRIAPHLVEPLPMLIPFHGAFRRAYFGVGLWLYDTLAGRRNIGRRRHVSRQTLAEMEPDMALDGVFSAAVYYDCKVHSARLVLENLFDASSRGAAIVNYCAAVSWRRGAEDVFEVRCEDRDGGAAFDVRARRVVDARGPWDDSGKLRLVRGSHIVVPRLTRDDRAIAHFNADGRILFIIPWGVHGDLSLVGTTDIDHSGSADRVRISAEEVAYLRNAAGALYPHAALEPVAAYSSLRPLIAAGKESAAAASRGHEIAFDAEGVLKIGGGKYTTYRAMSEQAASLLFPDLGGASATGTAPLGGPDPAAEGVLRFHGVHAREALRLPRFPSPLDDGEAAAIEFAVRREMALRLPDLMFVSTYWGHERRWSRESLAPYAEYMGRLLGWTPERTAEETAAVLDMTRLPE